jgi:hypothetical protein
MDVRTSSSPLRQALVSTGVAALFGIAIRFVWGAVDPEMRTWTFTAIAPWSGVYTYLHASGRLGAIANTLIALGAVGFIFWIAVIVSGRMPISRSDLPYALGVLAFPLAALALGLYQRRRLQGSESRPAA